MPEEPPAAPASKQKGPLPSSQRGPLPLVIGITGHRDLRKEDDEPLRKAVRAVFDELASDYPHTPMQLISGLAEGADRLVADVALECGIALIACLPMEKAAYLNDFHAEESRREFDALLTKSARVVELPWEGGVPADHGPARTQQYQALGEYIVMESQVLIALWDGVDTKLPGGTSTVVRMQLGMQSDGGDIDPQRPLDFPETGPVYQIVTPRVKNPKPGAEPYRIVKLCHRDTTGEAASEFHAGIFKRMDAFNEDALKRGFTLVANRDKSRGRLLPDDVRSGAAAPLEGMTRNYALASALAAHYQELTRRSMRMLFFDTGLSAAFLFACFGHGPEALQFAALLLYVAAALLALGVFFYAERRQFKTKYLDYRALTEGLRLQIFWRLAGLRENVADYYLRKQKTDLDWIRNAVRVWNTECSGANVEPNLELVRDLWVKDQCRFFERAAKRDEHHSEVEKRWSQWLLGATLAIAVVLILTMSCSKGLRGDILRSDIFERFGHPEYKMELHGVIVMIMGMLPAVAGVMAGFSLKMAYGEQKKQYQRMWKLFNRGSECLNQALAKEDRALALRTILDLGREALEENGDWVLLHRERTLEMRLGG